MTTTRDCRRHALYAFRDIKADNILLAYAGDGAIHIKVADFGVAVVLATASGSAGLLSRSSGTHKYSAPERAKSQKLGLRCQVVVSN